MREIKFRAWDKQQKRYWTQEEMEDIGGFYYTYGVSPDYEEFDLQQYTGLKDKNGKEIYEGDIVNITNENNSKEVWSVEYDDKEAKFVVFNQLNSTREFTYDFGCKYNDCPVIEVTENKRFYPEVLGNIYENPDLLTPTKPE